MKGWRSVVRLSTFFSGIQWYSTILNDVRRYSTLFKNIRPTLSNVLCLLFSLSKFRREVGARVYVGVVVLWADVVVVTT